MNHLAKIFRVVTEGVAGLMMAAIFCIFIVQIAIRYIVGSEWFTAVIGGAVDAADFGWTVESILVLWLWIIFWGNAFIVRDNDHVKFDIIYASTSRPARTIMTIFGSAVIVIAMWASIEPTFDRMRILRLKSSATLPVKMLDIYAIYFLFLAGVGLRYLWRIAEVIRHGPDRILHGLPEKSTREEESDR